MNLRQIGLCSAALLAAPYTFASSDNIEQRGEAVGIAINVAALSSTLFLEEGWEGTMQYLAVSGLSALTIEAGKSAIDKERPNGNCCNSFPSGHSGFAFAGAAFINDRYGWEYGVPAYLAASYAAYARVEADKHYVEDVVAGALISVAYSYFITDPYFDENLTTSINVVNGTTSINFDYRF